MKPDTSGIMFKVLVIASLISVGPLAHAKSTTTNLSISASSGKETEDGNYAGVNSKCGTRSAFIKVKNGPAHGSISIKSSKKEIPSTATLGSIPKKCIGKSVSSKLVSYKSDSGFRGRDSFTLRVGYSGGYSQTVNVTVSVK